MINYIEKFLLVIFGIKKKPLCEERLLFYVSVSHSLLSGICSASSLGLVPRKGMFAAPAVPKQLHRLGTTVS